MSFGYTGKILRVNLTTKEISVETPSADIYRTYMGGRALAAYYLLREVPKGCDPLGPENRIVFATSPLVGLPIPGACRYSIAAKSPLTEGYGESEAGGWWGPELKFAGFDAIIVEGRATEPVFLWVNDGSAEIRPARSIWGLETGPAQEAIRKDVGHRDARVVVIGPAGERQVRYACALNELKHVNGRTGMGAVMGSKNLKAIAVKGARKSLDSKDPKAISAIARKFAASYKGNFGNALLGDLGTAAQVAPLQATGMLPTRYFQSGTFDGADSLTGESMKASILLSNHGCFACPVRCKRVVKTSEPFEIDPAYGGPEYETIAAFGSLCGNADLKVVAKAHELCNRLGLDTISTGGSIAFLMECLDRSILTPEVAGVNVRFGDGDGILRLIEMIARREGVGDMLAEGVKRAARRLGAEAEALALHVKGQELPMHEPRGKVGVGLGYAVSPTGADHLQGVPDTFVETRGPLLDAVGPLGIFEPVPAREFGPEKVRNFVYFQHFYSALNVLDICQFTFEPGATHTADMLVDALKAATGWNTSLWEIMKAGERGTTLARAFNVREGLGPQDDSLPPRLLSPLGGGPLEGKAIDEAALRDAVRLYYSMMGWSEDGVPTPGKLAELGISWVRDVLDRQ